jgi:hypothetical protein
MSFKVVPIDMILAPNSWKVAVEKWTVTAGVADDLWGQITITDALGVRPYVPALGSTLQAVWQRGDYIGSITNQGLTVVKVAVMDSNFRSLVKFSISSADATNIISGTVVFTLTEGTNVEKWTQNWAVKKLNTSAGC